LGTKDPDLAFQIFNEILSFLSFAKTMATNVACQAFVENVVNQLLVESLFRI